MRAHGDHRRARRIEAKMNDSIGCTTGATDVAGADHNVECASTQPTPTTTTPVSSCPPSGPPGGTPLRLSLDAARAGLLPQHLRRLQSESGLSLEILQQAEVF